MAIYKVEEIHSCICRVTMHEWNAPKLENMNTGIISRKVHGMIDYPYSGLLMASPWLFDFKDEKNTAFAVPIAIGASSALTSLTTDYESGVVKKMPMKLHLAVDVASGLLLAASPFVFGFYKKVWLPHVALGLLTAGMGLLTRKESA